MKKRINLAYQVLLGMGLGVLVGTLSSHLHWTFATRLSHTFNLIFADFLQWLIPLFIISYMVPTITKISSSGSNILFKALFHTILFCYLGTFLSVGIGKLLLPRVLTSAPEYSLQSIPIEPFFHFPLIPILSISQALILAILLIIFGRFTSSSSLIRVLMDVQEWIKNILEKLVLPLIPFYIWSVFVRISSQGPSTSILLTLLPIVIVTVICCISTLLFYNAILWLFRVRLSPWGFFRSYKTPLGFALASQSSSATLPITLTACYENKMDPETTQFVIPFTTSINATGGSICVVISAMSVVVINGLSVTWQAFFSFILNVPLAIFTSAGIPGGSSFVVAPLLSHSLGFNSSSVGFAQAVILIQDPLATATNVMSCILIAIFFSSRSKQQSLKEIT